MYVTEPLKLLREAYRKWSEHKAPRLGAALAFYTIFALTPLLSISIAVASVAFGTQAQARLTDALRTMLGNNMAQAVSSILASAHNAPHNGPMAAVLSVLVLIIGAAGLFGELQDDLNTVWDVAPQPDRTWWAVAADRLLSFTVVLGTAFLLLLSLLLSVATTAAATSFAHVLPIQPWELQLVNEVIGFGIITLLFAMIFKVLPDARIAWKDVWLGAALTALLFVLGKFVLALYLGHSSISSMYGAAGSMVALLLWVYYAAQILFFGAELTQAYANRYGSHVLARRSNHQESE